MPECLKMPITPEFMIVGGQGESGQWDVGNEMRGCVIIMGCGSTFFMGNNVNIPTINVFFW